MVASLFRDAIDAVVIVMYGILSCYLAPRTDLVSCPFICFISKIAPSLKIWYDRSVSMLKKCKFLKIEASLMRCAHMRVSQRTQ